MSNWYRVTDPEAFLESLGGLHDARIMRLEWLPSSQRLTIEVDDLYSNFLGLPEYKAIGSGSFAFASVQEFHAEIDTTSATISIYDLRVGAAQSGMLGIRIELSPGGSVDMICKSLEIDTFFDGAVIT